MLLLGWSGLMMVVECFHDKSIETANKKLTLTTFSYGLKKHFGPNVGSTLVRVSSVPVPAFIFGSGLISLVGVARRKKV